MKVSTENRLTKVSPKIYKLIMETAEKVRAQQAEGEKAQSQAKNVA